MSLSSLESHAALSPAGQPAAQGLYNPQNEHDACGVGFVAHIKGVKTHSIIQQGLKILENLDHRGAVGADKLMGDGAGILIQIPDALYREDMAAQGVTLVTRGTDLLPATHVQRLLQALLGLPEPQYAHHRLILDAAGRKFSKRDGAVTLKALREAGATPADIRARIGL